MDVALEDDLVERTQKVQAIGDRPCGRHDRGKRGAVAQLVEVCHAVGIEFQDLLEDAGGQERRPRSA